MTVLQIELKPELAEVLQNRAEAEGQSVNEYLQDFLTEYLPYDDEENYMTDEEEMAMLRERIALSERPGVEATLLSSEQVRSILDAERAAFDDKAAN